MHKTQIPSGTILSIRLLYIKEDLEYKRQAEEYYRTQPPDNILQDL